MDEDAVTALEASIADLGTLLVQMDKFRAAETPEARALHQACLAIGDRARRAHRHGALDPSLARELGADAVAARAALERWLETTRSSALYRDAVSALAAGDDARLRGTLSALYAGADTVEPPDALFHPVAWQRRGRPRTASDIAEDLAELRGEGLVGEDDAAMPGVDPLLPGVVLSGTPPVGAPVYLVLRGDARPRWVLSLQPSGDLIAPGARLVTTFAVALADPVDDELDEWTPDPSSYRDALSAALRTRGIPLDGGEK